MHTQKSQSCLTLGDPTDYNLPVSSVHGIILAKILPRLPTQKLINQKSIYTIEGIIKVRSLSFEKSNLKKKKKKSKSTKRKRGRKIVTAWVGKTFLSLIYNHGHSLSLLLFYLLFSRSLLTSGTQFTIMFACFLSALNQTEKLCIPWNKAQDSPAIQQVLRAICGMTVQKVGKIFP